MGDDSSGSLEGKSLSNLRVVDLKLELEKRGLSKSGSKKELVKRLKQKLELEKLYSEAATVRDTEPKLHLDEATEQNEFVRQYLADQQKKLKQMEMKRIIELRGTQSVDEDEETDSDFANKDPDSDVSEPAVTKNSCDSAVEQQKAITKEEEEAEAVRSIVGVNEAYADVIEEEKQEPMDLTQVAAVVPQPLPPPPSTTTICFAPAQPSPIAEKVLMGSRPLLTAVPTIAFQLPTAAEERKIKAKSPPPPPPPITTTICFAPAPKVSPVKENVIEPPPIPVAVPTFAFHQPPPEDKKVVIEPPPIPVTVPAFAFHQPLAEDKKVVLEPPPIPVAVPSFAFHKPLAEDKKVVLEPPPIPVAVPTFAFHQPLAEDKKVVVEPLPITVPITLPFQPPPAEEKVLAEPPPPGTVVSVLDVPLPPPPAEENDDTMEPQDLSFTETPQPHVKEPKEPVVDSAVSYSLCDIQLPDSPKVTSSKATKPSFKEGSKPQEPVQESADAQKEVQNIETNGTSNVDRLKRDDEERNLHHNIKPTIDVSNEDAKKQPIEPHKTKSDNKMDIETTNDVKKMEIDELDTPPVTDHEKRVSKSVPEERKPSRDVDVKKVPSPESTTESSSGSPKPVAEKWKKDEDETESSDSKDDSVSSSDRRKRTRVSRYDDSKSDSRSRSHERSKQRSRSSSSDEDSSSSEESIPKRKPYRSRHEVTSRQESKHEEPKEKPSKVEVPPLEPTKQETKEPLFIPRRIKIKRTTSVVAPMEPEPKIFEPEPKPKREHKKIEIILKPKREHKKIEMSPEPEPKQKPEHIEMKTSPEPKREHKRIEITPEPEPKPKREHKRIEITPEPEPKPKREHKKIEITPEPEPKPRREHKKIEVAPEPEPKSKREHKKVESTPEPKPKREHKKIEMSPEPEPKLKREHVKMETSPEPEHKLKREYKKIEITPEPEPKPKREHKKIEITPEPEPKPKREHKKVEITSEPEKKEKKNEECSSPERKKLPVTEGDVKEPVAETSAKKPVTKDLPKGTESTSVLTTFRKLNFLFGKNEAKKAKETTQKKTLGSSLPKTSLSISTRSLKSIIPDINTVYAAPSVSDQAEKPINPELEAKVSPPPAEKVLSRRLSKELPLKEFTANLHEPLKKHKREVVRDNSMEEMEQDGSYKHVVLPEKPPSNTLFIRNLVRPFTLLQLKQKLKETGEFVEEEFWIDKIKSKCFVTYQTEEDATKTLGVLHNNQWPLSNPKLLCVEYSTKDEMEAVRNAETQPKQTAPVIPASTQLPEHRGWSRPMEDTRETSEPPRKRDHDHQDGKDHPPPKGRERREFIREWDRDKIIQESPDRERDRRRTSTGEDRGHGSDRRREKRGRPETPPRERERVREKEAPKKKKDEEAPGKLLDDLFHKSKATPCIYWLPLNEELIKEREEQMKLKGLEREEQMKLRRLEREKRRQLEEDQAKRRPRERVSRSRSRSPARRR